jgi:hypothetical protein
MYFTIAIKIYGNNLKNYLNFTIDDDKVRLL